MGKSFYGKMIEDLDRLPAYIQGWIKWMHEMFNEAVRNNPWALRHIPDGFKTEEVCNEAVEVGP